MRLFWSQTAKLNLSQPQFPSCKMEIIDLTTEVIERSNRRRQWCIRHLEQHLTYQGLRKRELLLELNCSVLCYRNWRDFFLFQSVASFPTTWQVTKSQMNASHFFCLARPLQSLPPLLHALEFQPVKVQGEWPKVEILHPKPPGLINFGQFLLLATLPPPQLPLSPNNRKWCTRLSLCSERRKNVLSIHITRQRKCFQNPSLFLFMFFEPKNHLEKPCCSST